MHGLKRYLLRLGQRTPGFLTRLATHLEAGFGARQSLELARPPVAASERHAALSSLDAGQSLAEALAHLRILEDGDLRVLAAAERAGRLPRALHRWAEELEASRDRTRALLARLIYPLLLIHLAPVARKSADIFVHGRLAAGLTYVLVCWATLWVSLVGLRVLLVDAERRVFLSRCALSLPLLGPLFRARAIAEYFRLIGGLYSAGVPLLDAHESATACMHHPHVRRSLEGPSHHLRAGGTLSELLGLSGILRDEEQHLLATGERSGHLEETFERLARLCGDEANARAASLVRLAGATLYAIAVLVVALTAIGFWSSYFDMMNSLRR
ncbi:MAG: type II secretion system F family protein [Planctomycetes bacterium]|nr:type II secretion system F family protein [Planctomycetota bacterium]